MVVTKDNSSLTNKYISFDNWICVPNPESSPVQFRQTLQWHCPFLVAIQGLEISAKQTNKNHLIDLTFLFYLPHHLLNNLNIYYYNTTNNKITKASLSMILSFWSMCSFSFAQWKNALAEVINWWSLDFQFNLLIFKRQGLKTPPYYQS